MHATGLDALEQQLAVDLERLNLPPKPWCPPPANGENQTTCDVLIIGASMCGLAAAFALRCAGIVNIRHTDHRDDGHEGPWLNYARMQTLRSPKHLTGPSLGFANLTFRAWYEAQHGSAGWQALDRIDRTVWMDFLRWYRKVTAARVDNHCRVTRIRPGPQQVMADIADANGKTQQIAARQVILATGREGQSQPRVPDALATLFSQPDKRVQHSAEDINFQSLQGKRVAVIGLSASAFDNAACALEADALQVTVLGRASALPAINKMKQTVYPGFTHGYPALNDEWKLRIMRYIARTRIAPPRASVLRIAKDTRAQLQLDAEIKRAEPIDDAIRLHTKTSDITVDRVILATGFSIDMQSPAECTDINPHLLLWQHRMPDEPLDEWMRAPYLGDGFEFRSRIPDALPGLQRIRCFTHTAQLSLGNLANDIPAVSEGANRLATAVVQAMFVDEIDYHWQQLTAYDDPELRGDEWPAHPTRAG